MNRNKNMNNNASTNKNVLIKTIWRNRVGKHRETSISRETKCRESTFSASCCCTAIILTSATACLEIFGLHLFLGLLVNFAIDFSSFLLLFQFFFVKSSSTYFTKFSNFAGLS